METDRDPARGSVSESGNRGIGDITEAVGFRKGYREGFLDGAKVTLRGRDDADGKGEEDEKDAAHDEKEQPPKSRLRRILPYAIGAVVLVLLIGGGVYYWLSTRDYESTDDAFIDAHTAAVSSQIAGRVAEVLFDDNQLVSAGQLLLQIDPRDYQMKFDQSRASLGNAQAELAQARAQQELQQANVEQAAAQVRVADAELQQARQDLARYRAVDPRATTRQQVDNATAQVRTGEARLDASRHAVTGARAQVDAAGAKVAAATAHVQEAQADVRNAELQLSYTRIVAPVAGRVAKRHVELGTYATPGQALLAVVPAQMWVTANFKETQLTDMRPGDSAEIRIDTYPGVTFHGRVDSFQTGTGSAFSMLPAENATGNYVKVVQRLPVKIVFDDPRVAGVRLAPGLSVVPRVKVR